MEIIMEDAETGNLTSKGPPLALEKLISFKDPRILWEEHWFAVVFEIASALILFHILRHAKRKGAESFYFVLAAVSCAVCVEILPILPRPGYQLWWYHQGIVNILHQRVPSFIITSFAIVHYVAHNLTENSNLPTLTKSFATAVFATLLYFPSVWLAPRLLLTLLHFDDPVFKDRFLDIPYIQILVIFLLFFHTSHLFLQTFEAIEIENRNGYNYTWCSVQSGFVSAVYTIVEQFVLYIWFTLTLKANSGLCLLATLVILTLLSREELKSQQLKSYLIAGTLQPLKSKAWWVVVGIFVLMSTLPIWLETSNLRSNGSRLELGPCHVTHEVANTSPLEILRRRFVCPEDGQSLAFDFHCVNKNALALGVQHNVERYTVCGKPLDEPLQIANNMAIYSAVCLLLFYNFLRVSFEFENEKKMLKENKKLQ